MSSGDSRHTALWRDVFEAADRALELQGPERRAFFCDNFVDFMGPRLPARA